MATNVIVSFTSGGLPAAGLTPVISIRNVDTLALVVNTASMSEVGDGWYKYNFTTYTASVDYAMTIDARTDAVDARYSFAGNENFAEDIWSTPQATHMSESVSFTRQIEGGSWIIQGSQMIFYDSGSGAEIARFNLQDSGGSAIDPSTQNPFRRIRV